MEPNNKTEFKFKTSINCGGCIAKISPILDTTKGVEEWNVDTTNPNKILTIISDGITADEVVSVVQDAGFKCEVLA